MSTEFISFLRGWADGRSRAGDGVVEVDFAQGPDDRPKRGAWVQLMGQASMGQLTVWESGEVELEVYRTADAEVVMLVSAEGVDLGRLSELLGQLSFMSRTTSTDSVLARRQSTDPRTNELALAVMIALLPPSRGGPPEGMSGPSHPICAVVSGPDGETTSLGLCTLEVEHPLPRGGEGPGRLIFDESLSELAARLLLPGTEFALRAGVPVLATATVVRVLSGGGGTSMGDDP